MHFVKGKVIMPQSEAGCFRLGKKKHKTTSEWKQESYRKCVKLKNLREKTSYIVKLDESE